MTTWTMKIWTLAGALALPAAGSVCGAPRAARGEVPPASPFHVFPLAHGPARSADVLAVLVSGASGWGDAEAAAAAELLRAGVPVVGIDAARAFTAAESPEEMERQVDRWARAFCRTWKRARVLYVDPSAVSAALASALDGRGPLPSEVPHAG